MVLEQASIAPSVRQAEGRSDNMYVPADQNCLVPLLLLALMLPGSQYSPQKDAADATRSCAKEQEQEVCQCNLLLSQCAGDPARERQITMLLPANKSDRICP